MVGHYRRLIQPDATETLTGLLERSAPYALRLAMLFALTDKSLTVDLRHLDAALAWVKYTRQSVRYIFTSASELSENENDRNNADKIVAFLRSRPNGATRTEISEDCFAKHASRTRIDNAIKMLLSESPPKITVTSVPRSDGKPGKGTNLYRIFSSSSSEVSEFSEVSQPARDTAKRTHCEVREVRSENADDEDLSSQSSQKPRKPESRAISQTSQNSQSSPNDKEKTASRRGLI